MDPNKCAQTMIQCYHEHNMEEAEEHAQYLSEWLSSGGFSPDMDNEGWEIFRFLQAKE